MVKHAETPTGAFYVLDMALLLPAAGLTAIWLWRKRAIGYTLAGALLTNLLVVTLALVAEIIFTTRYGVPGVTIGKAATFGVVSVIALGMLIWFLRGLRKIPKHE